MRSWLPESSYSSYEFSFRLVFSKVLEGVFSYACPLLKAGHFNVTINYILTTRDNDMFGTSYTRIHKMAQPQVMAEVLFCLEHVLELVTIS
jgi:hypothetical protein